MKTFSQFLTEMSPHDLWLRNGGYEIGKRHPPEIKDKYQGPLNNMLAMAEQIGGHELQLAITSGIHRWGMGKGLEGLNLVTGVIK